MRPIFWLALLPTLLGGCSGPPQFIVVDSDYAEYATWPSFDLGDAPLMGHPAGERVAYLNQKAPVGATQYPMGTILIKEVRTVPDDPTKWDLFAMVKRGGNYDSDGARGWEFLILKRTASGAPLWTSRGEAPRDSGDGGAGSYEGSGLNGKTCTTCHGAVGTEQHDYILSPLLYPGIP